MITQTLINETQLVFVLIVDGHVSICEHCWRTVLLYDIFSAKMLIKVHLSGSVSLKSQDSKVVQSS